MSTNHSAPGLAEVGVVVVVVDPVGEVEGVGLVALLVISAVGDGSHAAEGNSGEQGGDCEGLRKNILLTQKYFPLVTSLATVCCTHNHVGGGGSQVQVNDSSQPQLCFICLLAASHLEININWFTVPRPQRGKVQ